MIVPSDITGVDEDLATRVLAKARLIAPCLDSLEEWQRAEAIVIIRGVAVEAARRGSHHIKRQRVASASVDYGDAASWFSADDRSTLRAMCGSLAGGGLPEGHFPRPAKVITSMWPEEH